MIDRLPLELVACIGAAAEYPTLVSLSGVCAARTRRRCGTWWPSCSGAWSFWTRALNRPTLRTFKSMRDELAHIHRLQERSRAHNLPVWTRNEYYVFWEYEAATVKLRSVHQSRLRVPGTDTGTFYVCDL